MNIKYLSYLLFSSFIISQTLLVVDLTDKISPLGIVPNPQNGYGNGDDQLAQPDDVELLSDGSMIVTISTVNTKMIIEVCIWLTIWFDFTSS